MKIPFCSPEEIKALKLFTGSASDVLVRNGAAAGLFASLIADEDVRAPGNGLSNFCGIDTKGNLLHHMEQNGPGLDVIDNSLAAGVKVGSKSKHRPSSYSASFGGNHG